MTETAMRVLLLAGTSEARRLAEALAERSDVEAIASLAGAVAEPARLPVETRIGGFGGIDGLRRYIEAEGIGAVIDATHPFAAQISANAAAACAAFDLPLLRLERPPWRPETGDRWHEIADLAAAAALLPDGARAFVAVGRKEIGAFAHRRDLWCLMRMIDAPDPGAALPPGQLLLDRPGASVAAESELLQAHRIGWIVAKNSGGSAAFAKIAAARALGLPVVMVRRPALTGGAPVATVAEVLAWLDRRCAERMVS